MAAVKMRPCPVCGKDIPIKAKACHHCGADEKTGWNEEDTAYDGLDLPDEDFDYEKFTEEEFGTPRSRPRKGKAWLWWTVSIVLIVVLVILAFADQLFQ